MDVHSCGGSKSCDVLTEFLIRCVLVKVHVIRKNEDNVVRSFEYE